MLTFENKTKAATATAKDTKESNVLRKKLVLNEMKMRFFCYITGCNVHFCNDC